ncbi:MAG: DUF4193 domain-containing protein [Sciscionella sp.]
MATDYDAPRAKNTEPADDALAGLKVRQSEAQSSVIDVDDDTSSDDFELPGADLSALSMEELSVRVIPLQTDEFTCAGCYLVQHRSRLAEQRDGRNLCRDCA